MDKQIYDVAQGVSWVNGKPVPANRQVELTEAEAQYDLGHGRIALRRPDKARTAAPASED